MSRPIVRPVGAESVALVRQLLSKIRVPNVPYAPQENLIDGLKFRGLLERLQEVDKFFQRYSDSALVDDSLVSAIFAFLTENICNAPPPILPAHLCPVNLGPLKSGNLKLHLIVHKIFLVCLRLLPHEMLQSWLSGAGLRFLVGWLDSPDEEEQRSADQVVRAVFDAFSDMEPIAVALMEARLSLIPTGDVPYPCVQPYLQFIMRFYQARATLPSPRWFRTTVLPLFASPFLPAYHKELDQFCAAIEGYYDDLPAATTQYLLRHWPETNSAKILPFIASLGRSARQVDAASRMRLAVPIFARLGCCLQSANRMVITWALELLADVMFVGLFTGRAERVIGEVFRAANKRATGADPEIKTLAQHAVDTMRSMDGEVGGAGTEPEDASHDNWKKTWEEIRMLEPA